MFKRVRVGVERLFADSRIEATPTGAVAGADRGLTTDLSKQEAAPMERTQVVPVSLDDGRTHP